MSLTDVSVFDISFGVMGSELDFLPVSAAVFHILVALGDGEKHGYAIMQEVSEATEGQIQLGPGTLYGAIKKLLADGLIEETSERMDRGMDESRRRYYRLSKLGARVAAAEAQRLSAVVKLARRKKILAAV